MHLTGTFKCIHLIKDNAMYVPGYRPHMQWAVDHCVMTPEEREREKMLQLEAKQKNEAP